MNSKILIRSLLFVSGFLFQNQTNAQMYVGPSTYVFAKNQFVYIKQDLNLSTTTSNFYLRNDGQLLQGTTGAGGNSGVGNLSVFQEGTVNNYAYNYWCSPVGNTLTSTTVNNPFGITQLKDIVDQTNSNNPTILPTNNYDGTASPFAISPYWVWKLITKSAYSDWTYVGSATTINPSEGFTMKGSSGTNITMVNDVQNNPGSNQRYDFRGKPNDGTISIPVAVGQYTLTGNPYPSAINLQAFLIAETNCTGSAYFWEHDKTVNSHYLVDSKGGYGTYSSGVDLYAPATFYTYDGAGNPVFSATSPGIIYERKYSPIGQGFMIERDPAATGTTVEMKNSYRLFMKEGVANNSQFEKKANDKNTTATNSTETTPLIRFNTLLNNQAISQMVLAFNPLSTDGVDRTMDASSPNGDAPAEVYFVMNNAAYIIDVVPFDINKKIAIGFRNTAQANYKITVNEILALPEVENVYLHDKVTDVYYHIKNSLYDLTLPTGVNNTQYEITFKNGSLGVVDLTSQSFLAYQDNTTKNLTISNPLQIELASCALYDVVGKLIFIKKQLGSDLSYKFSTSNLSDGIYIVKITTKDEKEIGQKIIIKN